MTIQDCAVVLSVMPDKLEVMRERQVLVIPRPEGLDVESADWVAYVFNEESGQYENIFKLLERRWNSRLNADYDMLFTVNATVRDGNEFPSYAVMPPEAPWSFELEWLQDPKSRMTTARQVYPGVMYEVTVRMKKELSNRGRKLFEVVSVDDESPIEMQLELRQAPWVDEAVPRGVAEVRGQQQSLINRPPGRLTRNNTYQGLLYKSYCTGNLLDGNFVWCMESGSLKVHDRGVVNFTVGEWVKFEAATIHDSIQATKLRKVSTDLRKTEYRRSQNTAYALVLLRVPIPTGYDRNRFIEIDDEYLGKISFNAGVLNRQLETMSYQLNEMVGKVLLVWVKPSRKVNNQITWELDSIDALIYEEVETHAEHMLAPDLIAL